MTDDEPNVQAPPAPPAPPSAGAVSTTAAVAGKTLQQTLAEIAVDITNIARAVPTPNVTDSDLHGRLLHEIAAKLRALSEKP